MVEIRFFAMLKRLAGMERKEYELSGSVTVSELKEMLSRDIPSLRPVLEGRSLLISVNEEFAGDDDIVSDGDVIGLLPPFSGG